LFESRNAALGAAVWLNLDDLKPGDQVVIVVLGDHRDALGDRGGRDQRIKYPHTQPSGTQLRHNPSERSCDLDVDGGRVP